MIKTPYLVRSRHLYACVKAKKRLGRCEESLLKCASIPLECCSDGDALIPVCHLERFLSAACIDEDNNAFAYNAAPKDLTDYGALGQHITAFETLYDALNVIISAQGFVIANQLEDGRRGQQ